MKLATTHLETLAIHGGQQPDPETGAVMPPIVLSTTFAQEGPGKPKHYEYARTNNPTRATLERCIASLEGGTQGIAFASGCAAMTALFHTMRPGDHLIAGDDVYGGTYRILEKVMRPFGLDISWVDLTDLDNLKQAFTPKTRWVFLETPSNPMLKLTDIPAACAIARDAGARIAVDNTFATPILQQPLQLGADIVIHSTTKYLNGHSDVVGGCLVTSSETLAQELRFLQNATGAVPSPMDCFLVLRGLKTLPVRMERHCASARTLAHFLEAHGAVEKVHYPGLESHPQHALAAQQMRGFGGMVSFVVRGGFPAADRLLRTVSLMPCAESLGGVESLLEHPATMTHGSVPEETRKSLGIADGLLRMSVGLEHVADLENDLNQALG